MNYLLDTNVISETIKREPSQAVVSFLQSVNMKHFYISVLTLGEIRKGAEKLPDLQRKQKIVQWLYSELSNKFSGRIISIDAEVADKWGYISSKSNIPAIDGLIAASALAHNFKLITRNTKDFKYISGLEIINPWCE